MSVLILVFGMFAFTACGSDDGDDDGVDTPKECEHTYGEWQEKTPATCSDEGVSERICSACGESETAPIEKLSHTAEDDDNDCTTPVLCSGCGVTLVEGKDHEGEVIWFKTLTSHYKVYSCCYTHATEAEDHEKNKGVCTVCGFVPTVTVESKEASAGDTEVRIAISLKDNPGIAGIMINVTFNSDALALVGAESGDAFSALYFTAREEIVNGGTFIWDSANLKEKDVKDGEILILTFKVKNLANVGEYPIVISIKAYDNNLTPFELLIENGRITVVSEE